MGPRKAVLWLCGERRGKFHPDVAGANTLGAPVFKFALKIKSGPSAADTASPSFVPPGLLRPYHTESSEKLFPSFKCSLTARIRFSSVGFCIVIESLSLQQNFYDDDTLLPTPKQGSHRAEFVLFRDSHGATLARQYFSTALRRISSLYIRFCAFPFSHSVETPSERHRLIQVCMVE